MVILWVKHLGNDLRHGVPLHGPQIIAAVEQLHVKFLGLSRPQPQPADPLAVLAGNHHIIGHRQNLGGVLYLDGVKAPIPALLQVAVEIDGHRLFRMGLQPYGAAGQPEIRKLSLPAVHQLLTENTIFIPQGVAHSRIFLGGQAV